MSSMQKHNTPVVAPTWQLLCKSIFSGFHKLERALVRHQWQPVSPKFHFCNITPLKTEIKPKNIVNFEKPSMQKHNTPVVAPTWQLLCKSIFSGFAALKLRTMYSLPSWEIRQISAASYITSGQTIIIVQHKTTATMGSINFWNFNCGCHWRFLFALCEN